MTVEERVAEMIADYESGPYTRNEVLSRVIDWLTPTNIDEVVRAVPDEWREDVVRSLRRLSGYDAIFRIIPGFFKYEIEPDPVRSAAMFAALKAEREREAEYFETVVRPAIREWVRKQG